MITHTPSSAQSEDYQDAGCARLSEREALALAVVAVGAPVQAAPLKEVEDEPLLDVAPLSLGVETRGAVMTTVIERNATLPARRTEVFSTGEDNQSAVDVVVLLGERARAADNRVVGRLRLEKIRRAPRGVPRIEVTFDLAANGILNVSGRDQDSGAEQLITITETANLDQSEVERRIADADRHRAMDQRLRELADARSELDLADYQVERLVSERGEQIPVHVRARAENLAADARQALKDEVSLELLRNLAGGLRRVSRALAATGSGRQGAPHPPAGTAAGSGDDDVIYAELATSGDRWRI